MTNSGRTTSIEAFMRVLLFVIYRARSAAGATWARFTFALRTLVSSYSFRPLFKDASLHSTAFRFPVAQQRPHWFILEWQFWITLIAADSITIVMLANVPLWFGGSDHADYYNFGRFILGEIGVADLPQGRTPGMGLFHIISGTLLFDTWTGFIALSAIFSTAMPVLSYLIVRPYSSPLALEVGLVTIVSMTPYIYATMAGSDHVYYFLHLLLLLLCVTYLGNPQQRTTGFILGIALLAAYVVMVRPVGALIFWLFIAVATLARPRDWRQIFAASALYIAIMGAWVQWDRNYGTNGGAMPGTGVFPTLTELSTLPERRLAEAYFSPAGLVHAKNDAIAHDYPASEKLRNVLRNYVARNYENWREKTALTPPSLFAAYATAPEQLIDAVFAQGNSLYFSFILRAARNTLGAKGASTLFLAVAEEHGTVGIYGLIASFLRHPTGLLLGAIPPVGSRTRFASYYEAKTHPEYDHIGIPNPLLTSDLGPATRHMLLLLRNFISDYPQYWETAYVEQARYKSRPNEFYRAIIDGGNDVSENGRFEGFIYEVLAWYIGPVKTGQLYNEVTIEILRRDPRLALIAVDNFLYLTLLRNFGGMNAATLSGPFLLGTSDAYFISPYQTTRDLSRGLAAELIPVITTNKVWQMAAMLHSFVYLASPLFLYLLITVLPISLSPAMSNTTRWVCFFLLLVYAYEVTGIAIFTPWGTPRYAGTFYLLPLVISAIILGQAWTHLRNRQRRGKNQAEDNSQPRQERQHGNAK